MTAAGLGRDLFWAYMAGWSHGSSDRRRDMNKYGHDRVLSAEYVRGHREGKAARTVAETAMEERLANLEAAALTRNC